jgi:flagellar biosynthesis protein FliR
MPTHGTDPLLQEWISFLTAALLILVRISGMFVFAPPFANKAIPARIKMGLSVALTYVITPIAAASHPPLHLDLSGILGELAVGLLLGFCITLLQEILSFAGYLLNLEFSFSLVNVLDPTSNAQAPLMGQFTQLLLMMVLFAGGFYRVVIEAFMRTIILVPPGQAKFDAMVAPAIVNLFGGVLLAGLQLAAPIMAATFLVQVVVALIGKLSPSLPVMVVGIPIKTLTGYVVLIASLGLWPSFIDSRFSLLLDAAMQLMQRHLKA